MSKKTNEEKQRMAQKLFKLNAKYCGIIDAINEQVRKIVEDNGGFYMFEDYHPFVIIENFDSYGMSSTYEEAQAYAMRIKNGNLQVYVSACKLDATRKSLMNEGADEDWYDLEWDSGLVYEQAINAILVELQH